MAEGLVRLAAVETGLPESKLRVASQEVASREVTATTSQLATSRLATRDLDSSWVNQCSATLEELSSTQSLGLSLISELVLSSPRLGGLHPSTARGIDRRRSLLRPLRVPEGSWLGAG